jgi:SLT domain-containing protein
MSMAGLLDGGCVDKVGVGRTGERGNEGWVVDLGRWERKESLTTSI